MFISKLARRSIASLLCIALCMSLCLPVFAADSGSVSLQLNTNSLSTSETEQNVTLNIVTSEEVAIDSLMYTIEVPAGWSVAQPTMPSGVSGVTWANNQLVWYSSASDVTGLTNLGSTTITIPAGADAGSYEIKVTGFDASANATFWVEQASYTTTLKIEDAAISTDPYTANISTSATNNTVVNGQDIEVKVNVGGTTGTFSSAEIVLGYDPAYLTYKSATTSFTDTQAPDYEVDGANGTVTIRDYGKAITAADGVYTVTFTAAKGGETSVELTSAGFSTKDRAEQYDLLAATGVNDLDVTINHKVTVNNADAGSVAPGGSFECTIPDYDGNNNDYDITVTMGGTTQSAPTPDENGKFTISSVTGDLVITYTATAKNYTVTWSDNDNAVDDDQQVATVTHGTDIIFDVPANVDPVGTTDGYKYVVKVTETNDTTKSIEPASAQNTSGGLTYTIDSDLIEADITITITRETVAANQVTVTITGADVTASVNGEELTSPATVAKDSDVVLTLTPEVGYNYEVKLGETDITSAILDDSQYTIDDIAESVTVTVTRTLDTSSVNVLEYVQLDDTVMWLVTINGNGTTQIEGKTYSYDGNNMYWSSEYQAYCYLVVAENLDEGTAKAAIGETLVAQAATAVDYAMDVNISNTMDVNDAQLVWNMYSAEYSGFTTNVNMEKFLRADVNGSKAVDTSDAAAIITAIKNP